MRARPRPGAGAFSLLTPGSRAHDRLSRGAAPARGQSQRRSTRHRFPILLQCWHERFTVSVDLVRWSGPRLCAAAHSRAAPHSGSPDPAFFMPGEEDPRRHPALPHVDRPSRERRRLWRGRHQQSTGNLALHPLSWYALARRPPRRQLRPISAGGHRPGGGAAAPPSSVAGLRREPRRAVAAGEHARPPRGALPGATRRRQREPRARGRARPVVRRVVAYHRRRRILVAPPDTETGIVPLSSSAATTARGVPRLPRPRRPARGASKLCRAR